MTPQAAYVDFHRLMKDLLRYMNIDAPSDHRSEVYSFSFDEKTEVHICSPQPGALDMLVRVGILGNREANGILHKLLAMNLYRGDGMPLNVGMDPASGRVTLWTRHSLYGMEIQKLTSLLTEILDQADLCGSHLDGCRTMRNAPVKKRLII
jgi:hypothetical protein